MRDADRASAALGLAGAVLMDRAGWAVAEAARGFGPGPVLVVCGPGGNGGDGYVAARLLAARGWPVRVAATAPPRPGTDAAAAAARWRGPVQGLDPALAARAALVIDAGFGAGLDRDLPQALAALLAAAGRVLAVDVPSGLDGATGQCRGRVRPADCTLTFARLKPGHVLLPGRDLCGVVRLVDLGHPPAALTPSVPPCSLNRPGLWHLPDLAAEGHKYGRGFVTVLGGATLTGAARLAAAGARAAGAGLVAIAAAAGSGDLYRAACPPGIMVQDCRPETLAADLRAQVFVCGPGLGLDLAGQALAALLGAGRAVVADADALSACAGAPHRLRGAALLTPHAGEFARLFGPIGSDRVAAVRAAAALVGAVVLLKGRDTVVAAPDGRVAINAAAPPSLATAGSGDVLAGLAAGLLARGLNAFDAAAAAAWLHGRAGSRHGAGLLAEDIAAALPGAWAEALACAGPALP